MRLAFPRWLAAVLLGWPMVCQAADISVTGRAGGWTAFSGLSDNGTGVCGIFEPGADGRSFHIKSFAGHPDLIVQVFKQGWSIPQGTIVPATIQFDNFSPWTVPARGQGDMIEFRVPTGKVGEFVAEFAAANRFQLALLTGHEQAWTGQLAGSAAALGMLAKCVMTQNGSGNQPADRAPPSGRSQPFSPNPAPPAGIPRFAQPRQQNV